MWKVGPLHQCGPEKVRAGALVRQGGRTGAAVWVGFSQLTDEAGREVEQALSFVAGV